MNVRDFKALSRDVLFIVAGGTCLGVGLKKSGFTHKIVIAIPIAQACSIAMARPIIKLSNPIVLGSGLLEIKQILKPGIWIKVDSIIIILIVGMFYLPLIRI